MSMIYMVSMSVGETGMQVEKVPQHLGEYTPEVGTPRAFYKNPKGGKRIPGKLPDFQQERF